jgi:DNA processing protein
MIRAETALAIARIAFLSCAERAALAAALDGSSDLSVLSIRDLERLVARPLAGRSLDGKAWNPAELLSAAAEDAAKARAFGIDFVSVSDGRYPPLLRELPDPPTVLFYRGTLPDPERPLAAVVGTRSASAEALSQAYAFGRDFVRSGVPVVSGLALGIDAMAHRGAVEAGGPTIAVLGSGLDRVYPASNRGLARRVVEGGGALVGEYAPGTPPLRFHFPARNRIIAGLARALVVVEAPERSGALISAEFALEGGRDLWVGSTGTASLRGGGTRRLTAEGAPVAASAADVLAGWGRAASPPAERERPIRAGTPFRTAAARSLERELHFGAGPSGTVGSRGGVR